MQHKKMLNAERNMHKHCFIKLCFLFADKKVQQQTLEDNANCRPFHRKKILLKWDGRSFVGTVPSSLAFGN